MEHIEEKGSNAAGKESKPVRADRKRMARFEKAAERLHKKHSCFNSMLNVGFLLTLAVAFIVAFALRQFVFEPTLVDGESMENYLMDRERVAVNKTAYWLHEPERGDIVICHYPDRTERFVKRIIAFGGETITISDGYVFIDGERLDESEYAGEWYGHIRRLISTKGNVNGVYTVPEGYVFVMGDNRNLSKDSRSPEVGPIANEQILGKVVGVIWPISAIRCAG